MPEMKGRVRIQQKVALPIDLRDLLEKHGVLPPPTVPKMEVLEKQIASRRWSFEVHAGNKEGTAVRIGTPGDDEGGPKYFKGEDSTLALATTRALVKALEAMPAQAAMEFDEDDETETSEPDDDSGQLPLDTSPAKAKRGSRDMHKIFPTAIDAAFWSESDMPLQVEADTRGERVDYWLEDGFLYDSHAGRITDPEAPTDAEPVWSRREAQEAAGQPVSGESLVIPGWFVINPHPSDVAAWREGMPAAIERVVQDFSIGDGDEDWRVAEGFQYNRVLGVVKGVEGSILWRRPDNGPTIDNTSPVRTAIPEGKPSEDEFSKRERVALALREAGIMPNLDVDSESAEYFDADTGIQVDDDYVAAEFAKLQPASTAEASLVNPPDDGPDFGASIGGGPAPSRTNGASDENEIRRRLCSWPRENISLAQSKRIVDGDPEDLARFRIDSVELERVISLDPTDPEVKIVFPFNEKIGTYSDVGYTVHLATDGGAVIAPEAAANIAKLGMDAENAEPDPWASFEKSLEADQAAEDQLISEATKPSDEGAKWEVDAPAPSEDADIRLLESHPKAKLVDGLFVIEKGRGRPGIEIRELEEAATRQNERRAISVAKS